MLGFGIFFFLWPDALSDDNPNFYSPTAAIERLIAPQYLLMGDEFDFFNTYRKIYSFSINAIT